MLDLDRFRALQHLLRNLARWDYRRRTGLAWVEGTRALVRAVDHRRQFQSVVLCERLLQPVVAQMMVRRLRRCGTNVFKVSPEQFRAISRTTRASGIGAVLHQHWTPLDQLTADAASCWVAISRIRSPGNFGTILRTAEAAGAAGLIVLDPRADPFDARVMRGSMGSVLSLTLTRATLPELSAWAQRHDVCLIGTSPRGRDLFSTPIPRRVVILLGEERRGLTPAELEACALRLRIPMVPRNDSINVAVAAGIVLFEWRRSIQ